MSKRSHKQSLRHLASDAYLLLFPLGLSRKGYELWHATMNPLLTEMMGK